MPAGGTYAQATQKIGVSQKPGPVTLSPKSPRSPASLQSRPFPAISNASQQSSVASKPDGNLTSPRTAQPKFETPNNGGRSPRQTRQDERNPEYQASQQTLPRRQSKPENSVNARGIVNENGSSPRPSQNKERSLGAHDSQSYATGEAKVKAKK